MVRTLPDMARPMLRAILYLVLISGCISKSITKRQAAILSYENYGHQPEGSNVPYRRTYAVETAYPSAYEAAGSSNFGTYDISNSGSFLGNGFQGGLQSNLGYQGNLGLNQQNIGFSGPGAGFGYSGFGNGGFSSSGFSGNIGSGYVNQPGIASGGYIQRPFVTGGYGGLHGGHIGGGYVDRSQYGSSKKNVGDENLEKIDAKSGSSANQGNQGYNQGAIEQSSAKGDTGYYKDEVANKNQVGDGKSYQGATNYDKTGNNGDSENAQKSHKKGHVTKGYKSSHRKDEEEKTETFYDEAHDEADRKNYGQNQGSFGEKSEAAFKAGHENESLDSKAQGKEGHYQSQNKQDDSKANKGEYGQTAYKGNEERLHKVNGLGAQSILGQQEASGEYHGKKPYGILPINGDK